MAQRAHALVILVGLASTICLGACVSITATGVSTFSSSQGHFSATVPNGAMDEQTAKGAGHWDGAVVETFVNTQANGTRFVVVTVDSTDGYPQQSEVEAALDAMESSNVANTGGTQTSERHLQVGGLPAREQMISSTSASYVFRMVIRDTRAWLWSVKGTDVTAHDAMATLFLDSFALLP
jgi:hypothetical protein